MVQLSKVLLKIASIITIYYTVHNKYGKENESNSNDILHIADLSAIYSKSDS